MKIHGLLYMRFDKNKEVWGILITIFLCLIMAYPIIGHVLISPNEYMYTFGGDGLTIYYDMIYHVMYGNGTHFTGMNYPYGEMIYMTDAQGALTQILQWINSNVYNISDYIVGIVNFLNAFSIILGSIILYILLRKFKIEIWISIVFSALIILLSPQIFRLISHFGLAYLFAIPLCFLWIIRKQENLKIEWFDVFVFFLILFMTFNNPYLGFIMAAVLGLSGAYLWIKHRFKIKHLYISFIGVLPLLMVFSYLKFFDNVKDRLKIQWGYFDLMTLPEGVIRPSNSHMDVLLQLIGNQGNSLDFENKLNLGIVTVVLGILCILSLIFKKFLKSSFSVSETFKPILIASLLLFVYASGYFFLPFKQDFIEDKLSFMLMFKAVGRLSWPFYYSMTILAVLYLNHLFKNLNKPLGIVFVLLVAIIWKWEINTYVLPEFRDKKHSNFLSVKQSDKVLNIFGENNIKVSDFQAILSLPKLMTWTDNFVSEVNWSAQYNSMNISRTTGLPLINAMLSRMSIGQTAEKVELHAHPYIRKSLVDKLDGEKDILIVLGHDYPALTLGEAYLIDMSDTLYYEPNGFVLMRLAVKNINNNQTFKKAKEKIEESNHVNIDHFYMGYDEDDSRYSYFGKGSMKISKGVHNIFSDTLISPFEDSYTFSMWTRFDNKKYGIGWFTCEVKEENGNVIYRETPDTRRSNDVHGEWIRTEMTFPVKDRCTINITFDTNRELYIDELLIQPAKSTIIHKDTSKNRVLFNGYRIEL